jgi:hypothetical protein
MNCANSCKSWNYSSCIIWDAPKIENEYFEICVGHTLSAIIKSMANFMVDNVSESKVYASASDECTGYLADKINSETLDIQTETLVSGCEVLKVEIPTPEWEDITFGSTFGNQGSLDAAATVDALNHVHLRGRVTGTTITTTTTVCTLDLEYRPANTQHISVNVNNSGNYYPGVLQIQSSGVVSILCNTSGWTGTSGTFSLNCDYFID